MNGDRVDGESHVSGNKTNIPATIRRELDIHDGDRLRWSVEDDGTFCVDVVRQQRARSPSSTATRVRTGPT